jgi:hypothetical protein
MTGARHMIAGTKTLRKSRTNSLEHQASAYWSIRKKMPCSMVLTTSTGMHKILVYGKPSAIPVTWHKGWINCLIVLTDGIHMSLIFQYLSWRYLLKLGQIILVTIVSIIESCFPLIWFLPDTRESSIFKNVPSGFGAQLILGVLCPG